MVVVHDDLEQKVGDFKIMKGTSFAGHNGLKSIQEILGTSIYPRLRFGIGKNFFPGQQVNYVLGKWENIESEIVAEKIPIAIDCIKSYCLQGIAPTMNVYNNK